MISIIVARATNGVIGKAGDLPWKLPGEMAYFKRVTMGHPIVMGRKTHESIGRALPGRTNIIITRDPKYRAEGCIISNSLDGALSKAAGSPGGEEIFVIGGESVYAEVLPRTQKLYLTEVQADIDGDKFFEFDPKQWHQKWSEAHPADERDAYSFEFKILERHSGSD